MLEDLDINEWVRDVSIPNATLILSTDYSTINRQATTCTERAWALQITAQRLKNSDFCVRETARNDTDDAWLALCVGDRTEKGQVVRES
ncbi:MAG: hypothetical protein O2971_08560 [Proteobacteria bacterium]|nr:hypothetical protein [Pseudomonadota bacterium]